MEQEAIDVVHCGFGRGTLLSTARGEIPVEQVIAGDFVVTSSGSRRPVRGIVRGKAAGGKVVVIPANAVADGKPRRDLVVSSDHDICLKVVTDCLVPVQYLSQRATFRQKDAHDEALWQIELDHDDLVLAESLAVPSGPDVDAIADRMTDRRFLETISTILKGRAALIGWVLDLAPPLDLHIMADGVRIEPTVDGLYCRFILPATSDDVWLVSANSIPKEVGFNADARVLGACLAAMRIEDGLKVSREISLGDPLLTTGFGVWEETIRWTDGCAQLPSRLWSDCRDLFFLSIRLSSVALPRYRPPDSGAEVA